MASRHGHATLPARITDAAAPGQLFCAFHCTASRVNALTSDHADTVTSRRVQGHRRTVGASASGRRDSESDLRATRPEAPGSEGPSR
ncbi:molybdopterin dinucleotide binding domain-containing protein [Nonomuraea lactucae]|uniref:molybdopterin dinucleotide binding domain-containing protein n=1 Tax=Nonomuraea lactucae TaxID=2249762 RepID=UPI001F06F168|nr:molybdopterin dinucleotide binding domain-containing protein [Nonomuraea lactucae]